VTEKIQITIGARVNAVFEVLVSVPTSAVEDYVRGDFSIGDVCCDAEIVKILSQGTHLGVGELSEEVFNNDDGLAEIESEIAKALGSRRTLT
jgi:hypothetical protein